MGKDLGYDVFLRGEELIYEHLNEGRFVFFQRPISCGGGFWLVRTYQYFFEYVIGYPVSLREGIHTLLAPERRFYKKEGEDFQLSSPPSE